MKTVFFATAAAAAALIAAPAMAQDAIGSVGVSYDYTDVDGLGETNGATVDGIVATPIFGDWTVTMAGNVAYTDADFAGEDTSVAGAIALTKKIGTYRVGGFYKAAEAYRDTENTFGAVAQKYFDQATLTGVASYSTVYDQNVWSVAGEAAYYATPALRLAAGVSYSDAEFAGIDGDVWAAKVGAEYQVAQSPYSVFASYTYTDGDDFAIESDGIKVGVRYNFGGGLQARDQAGAGFGL